MAGADDTVAENGIIKSDIVANVMSIVDGGDFVPHGGAYVTTSQMIGYGAHISSPDLHAFALELLKDQLTEGKKALDVGSGSGYLSTCMAWMVGQTGKVVGIDHIPELVYQSVQLVKKNHADLLDDGRLILKSMHKSHSQTQQVALNPFQRAMADLVTSMKGRTMRSMSVPPGAQYRTRCGSN